MTVQLSLIFSHFRYLTTSSLPVLRCGPDFSFSFFFLSFHCGYWNIFFNLAQTAPSLFFFFAFLQKWACGDWTAAGNHFWGFHTSYWSTLTSCWNLIQDFPCASPKSRYGICGGWGQEGAKTEAKWTERKTWRSAQTDGLQRKLPHNIKPVKLWPPIFLDSQSNKVCSTSHQNRCFTSKVLLRQTSTHLKWVLNCVFHKLQIDPDWFS